MANSEDTHAKIVEPNFDSILKLDNKWVSGHSTTYSDRGSSAIPLLAIAESTPESNQDPASDPQSCRWRFKVPVHDGITMSHGEGFAFMTNTWRVVNFTIDRCYEMISERFADSDVVEDDEFNTLNKLICIHDDMMCLREEFEQSIGKMKEGLSPENLFDEAWSQMVASARESMLRCIFRLGVRTQQADIVLSSVDSSRQARSRAQKAGAAASSAKKRRIAEIYQQCFRDMGQPVMTGKRLANTTYDELRVRAASVGQVLGIETDRDNTRIRKYLNPLIHKFD
ncbi:MAG: hypothetical protein Phyf2KO_00580 [Phycisphaerales bacterium]